MLVLFFVEGGYRWAVRNQKRYDEHEKEAPVGAMGELRDSLAELKF